MKDIIIKHKILKSAEGSYYVLKFELPDEICIDSTAGAGIEYLKVSYSYNKTDNSGTKGKRKNIVDLGLSDPTGRFLGWSGSSRQEIYIGPDSSTKGYLMTNIKPGEWGIIVGAYRIPDDGLEVTYTVSVKRFTPRFLTGDLHVHSDASDGQFDIFKLTLMAKKIGLDFIAIANHNNFSENLCLPKVQDLTLIPAVEWTHYKGHINIFGIREPFSDSFIANNEEEMLKLITEAKEQGALISVNHPMCSLCPYLWEDKNCFDLVEVWNGPMRPDNIKAISWWKELLLSNKGRKIPIVGGSDYHRRIHPVMLGRPVTRVFAKSTSAPDILEAIENGRCYITSHKKGPELELKCGDFMMGDMVPRNKNKNMSLEIKASRLKFGMTVRLVTSEDSIIMKRQLSKSTFVSAVPVDPSWHFAYITVSRKIFGIEFIRAISNPIYLCLFM